MPQASCLTGNKSTARRRMTLCSAGILLPVFLLPSLLVCFSGDILSLFAPTAAPYFLQLHTARITWHPLFVIAAVLLTVSFSYLTVKRQKKTWLILFSAILFLAALCTMRVNGVPAVKALRVITAFADGGLL